MKRRHLFHSFVFLMTGLVTLAFGHVAQANNTTTTKSNTGEAMQEIEPRKDVYVIVSNSASAPFEFQDVKDEYEGVDVRLMENIARLQGFNIRMGYRGFSAALQASESGQADGMIAGMTVTGERKKNYDFSGSCFDSGIQLAVKKGDTSIKSYENLKRKAVGAKASIENAEFLDDHESEYGYSIKYFNAADQLYDGLRVGAIDAMMDDYPVIDYAVKQGQELETPIKKGSDGKYAFAVKRGQSPELLNIFNEGLKELKRTGEYDKIIKEYAADGSETPSESLTIDESIFLELIQNNYQTLLKGLQRTILLTLISFALVIIIGVIFGLFSIASMHALHTIASIYVSVIRGIPMMVLAFFIFFRLPGVAELTIPNFLAGIITLIFNAGAYIAEIVRGGINAVPVGQMKASRGLGLSYNRTIQKIILPQAVRIMIPSFVGQFVTSLKNTTIISAIGMIELLQAGKIIVARTTQGTYVYLIIAIMYLILITVSTKLAKILEKKMKQDGRKNLSWTFSQKIRR